MREINGLGVIYVLNCYPRVHLVTRPWKVFDFVFFFRSVLLTAWHARYIKKIVTSFAQTTTSQRSNTAEVRRSRLEAQCLDMRMLKGAFKCFCRLWSLSCGRRTFYPLSCVDRKLLFRFHCKSSVFKFIRHSVDGAWVTRYMWHSLASTRQWRSVDHIVAFEWYICLHFVNFYTRSRN